MNRSVVSCMKMARGKRKKGTEENMNQSVNKERIPEETLKEHQGGNLLRWRHPVTGYYKNSGCTRGRQGPPDNNTCVP